MRYVVIGAGAVGGAIGARLHETGREVVLVARGAHLQAIRSAGLRFATPAGDRTLDVPVVGGPEELELRLDDVLISCVKLQDAGAVVDQWAPQPVAGGATAAQALPYFCAHNGLEGERLALRRFSRVYGVCVYLPASYIEAGVVVGSSAPLTGVLTIGRYPAGTDDVCTAVSADLEASGFSAPVTEEVQPWKNAKLLNNLANSIDAVTGAQATLAGQALVERAVAEGRAVLDAAGLSRPPAEAETKARSGMSVQEVPGHPRPGSSSWQSLARGTGSVEADFLNGEVVLLGRLHGIPTPVNGVLQREAGRFAREGLAPGSATIADLEALIDAEIE